MLNIDDYKSESMRQNIEISTRKKKYDKQTRDVSMKVGVCDIYRC